MCAASVSQQSIFERRRNPFLLTVLPITLHFFPIPHISLFLPLHIKMIKTANPRATAAYPSPPHSLKPPGRRGSFFSAHDKRGMSSSLSPPYHQGPGNGAGPSDGSDRGPLGSLNLNFLKSLNDKRTTRGRQRGEAGVSAEAGVVVALD